MNKMRETKLFAAICARGSRREKFSVIYIHKPEKLDTHVRTRHSDALILVFSIAPARIYVYVQLLFRNTTKITWWFGIFKNTEGEHNLQMIKTEI